MSKHVFRHWELEDAYKKEIGYDVITHRIDGVNFYDEAYVEWLEMQIIKPIELW